MQTYGCLIYGYIQNFEKIQDTCKNIKKIQQKTKFSEFISYEAIKRVASKLTIHSANAFLGWAYFCY